MILLGHSYPKVFKLINFNKLFLINYNDPAPPKVRRTTADQLYTTLLTYDDILLDEEAESVMSLLSDVSW